MMKCSKIDWVILYDSEYTLKKITELCTLKGWIV